MDLTHISNQIRSLPSVLRVAVPFPSNGNSRFSAVRADGSPIVSQGESLLEGGSPETRWKLVEFLPEGDCQVSELPFPPAEKSELDSRRKEGIEFITQEHSLIATLDGFLDVSITIELAVDGSRCLLKPGEPREEAGNEFRRRWSWPISVNSNQSLSGISLNLVAETYNGTGVVEFTFRIRNENPMDHPGGNWDLGAFGHLDIESLEIRFNRVGRPEDTMALVSGESEAVIRAKERVSIFQASSGGVNWNSLNHMDRNRGVPMEFQGYRVLHDGSETKGFRAQPIVSMGSPDETISVSVNEFWQNFPVGIDAKPGEIRVGLVPEEARGQFELQGGEQKTWTLGLAFDQSHHPLAGAAGLSPQDYASRNAIPYLLPRSKSSDSRYEQLVDLAIDGDDTFSMKAEKIDQFGWRNFGDIYGDHEAVYHQGDSPMISHYNNQYDCVLGFAIQFMRTGDRRWFELMTQMADHAWDIDTYHTDQDKLLYNGGLFWHTYHYADAHTSTHRSYPKNLRVSQSFDGGQDLEALGETGEKLAKTYAIGGGPAAAHNYNTGWMIAYYLTGRERYREAAISAAEYVMRIDDGSKTPFRWLSRADTGFSTCSSDGYYGPGRAAANSTHALLTGHELTGEKRFLDRAALLMRRTVHPNQDLDSLDLLNAELRWFYTMYLQALGRFVDYKYSLGELDSDFRYGVATLQHYADWMVEHERPTLSQPEQLQYPTETWAAQDMRKWHVLQHCCLYQPDQVRRQRLQEKADFFFDDVCNSLTASPTKSLCRPVILMLNFGWQRDWFKANPNELRIENAIDDDFGNPPVFTPQREIALRRFKLAVLASGVISLILIAIVAYSLYVWLSK